LLCKEFCIILLSQNMWMWLVQITLRDVHWNKLLPNCGTHYR